MLILKRNFLKFKSWIGWMSVLLACTLAVPVQAAPPRMAPAPQSGQSLSQLRSPQHGPDTVATEFYGWYLDTLSADQDPLSDRYDTFVRYVSRPLASRLVERLKTGRAPDTDYFIQSTAYREAWRAVQTSVVRRHGGKAEVQVTLGKERRTMRVLLLSMVLEDGAWKISSVGLMGDDVFKSSAEQPVI
jgi:hypothetical protein